MNEKQVAKIKKYNMKLYPIYEMLGLDFLFYYGISVLFLSQVKNFSDSNIVLAGSIYSIFLLVMQIPSVAIVNKIGKRNCIIWGNILRAISIILVMTCMNFIWLIISYLVMAIGFGLERIASSPLLNDSIPTSSKKNRIFSNIDGKGYSKYCYLGCVCKVLSGYLYTINPYIPLLLCLAVLIIVIIISINFIDIEEEEKEKEKITVKENLQNIKSGFAYILKSKRLKALILMLGVVWGLLNLLSTYQTTLLKDINLSASYIGIIAAVVQLITGLTSKKANQFNQKFKNKSLTIMGLAITVGAIFIGGSTIFKIPMWIQLTIMISAFCIRHAVKGVYQILKKQYLGNFASKEMLPKIYASYNMLSSICKAIIEWFGSMLLLGMNIQHATLWIGSIFTIIVVIVAWYMKDKVGIEEIKDGRKVQTVER